MAAKPVALVTGAASGIGKHVALQLASKGYDLTVGSLGRLTRRMEARSGCQCNPVCTRLLACDNDARCVVRRVTNCSLHCCIATSSNVPSDADDVQLLDLDGKGLEATVGGTRVVGSWGGGRLASDVVGGDEEMVLRAVSQCHVPLGTETFAAATNVCFRGAYLVVSQCVPLPRCAVTACTGGRDPTPGAWRQGGCQEMTLSHPAGLAIACTERTKWGCLPCPHTPSRW